MGIIICGLNGAGKSTLGKALADKLSCYFIDIEDLYFPKIDPNCIYASPRTREEVKTLLLNKAKMHENFILVCVKGDYGEDIYPFIQYVILIDAPKDIRLQRVKERSFRKFGNRMLVGGDLHEQEESFFRFVKSRDENIVEEWVNSLQCPVMRIDGTKSIEQNTNRILIVAGSFAPRSFSRNMTPRKSDMECAPAEACKILASAAARPSLYSFFCYASSHSSTTI